MHIESTITQFVTNDIKLFSITVTLKLLPSVLHIKQLKSKSTPSEGINPVNLIFTVGTGVIFIV